MGGLRMLKSSWIVDCAEDSVPDSTKAQAVPGPSILVAGELW